MLKTRDILAWCLDGSDLVEISHETILGQFEPRGVRKGQRGKIRILHPYIPEES